MEKSGGVGRFPQLKITQNSVEQTGATGSGDGKVTQKANGSEPRANQAIQLAKKPDPKAMGGFSMLDPSSIATAKLAPKPTQVPSLTGPRLLDSNNNAALTSPEATTTAKPPTKPTNVLQNLKIDPTKSYVDRTGVPQTREGLALSLAIHTKALGDAHGHATFLGKELPLLPSFGTMKNALPGEPRTTYGRVERLANELFLPKSESMTLGQRLAKLGELDVAIKDWQNGHDDKVKSGSKPDMKQAAALGNLQKLLGQAIDETRFDASESRRKAVGLVDDEIQKAESNFGTLMRTDNPASAKLRDHLRAAVPADYLKGIAEVAAATATDVAKTAYAQGNSASQGSGMRAMGTKEFAAVLDGTRRVLEHITGGSSKSAARAAASALPEEIKTTLRAVDERVRNATGDDVARRNAFVGTLFLRYVTPTAAMLDDGHGGKDRYLDLQDSERYALTAMSSVLTSTVNGADVSGKNAVSADNIKPYQTFVESMQPGLEAFMMEVLK